MVSTFGFLKNEVRDQVNKAAEVSECLNDHIKKNSEKRNKNKGLQNSGETDNDIYSRKRQTPREQGN